VLVRGQPAVVGGPRKSLKTSILVDMAVALAAPRPAPPRPRRKKERLMARLEARRAARQGDTAAAPPAAPWPLRGRGFLGHFEVPAPVRVGLFSGESGESTLQETARRVCAARGSSLDRCGVYWGFHLPRLADPRDVDRVRALVTENRLDVVIFDPLYLALVGGDAELDVRNLFDVGPLLADLTAACLDAGATPVLAHHARKNRAPDERWEPLELEDLAYAGVQEFARQWVLISRRERYDEGTGAHRLWLSVGGSAGFGGLWGVDVEEGPVGDDFRGRRWDVCVLPAAEARRHAAAARERRREGEQAVKLSEARRKVLAHFHGHPAAETRNGLSALLRVNKASLERALSLLLEEGLAEAAAVVKAGKRHEGVRLTERARAAAAQAAADEAREGGGHA
jgi:hypothetical protein